VGAGICIVRCGSAHVTILDRGSEYLSHAIAPQRYHRPAPCIGPFVQAGQDVQIRIKLPQQFERAPVQRAGRAFWTRCEWGRGCNLASIAQDVTCPECNLHSECNLFRM
jgi:hypothetical protein